MRHYEVMFIMNAALPEGDRRETIERVEEEIEQLDGTVHRSKDYDVRQMAYPIENATRGHYRLMRFEVEPESVQTLKERLRLIEEVLRFIVVRPEDEQLAFVSSGSSDEDEEPESTADEDEEETAASADEEPADEDEEERGAEEETEETDADETPDEEAEDDAEAKPDDEAETAEAEEDKAAEAT